MAVNYKKRVLPVAILLVALLTYKLILVNPPEAQRVMAPKAASIVVETQILSPVSYQVLVDSYGVVKPRTQSALVAQVSGQIVSISPQFREGGFFEKGQVLVQLDDRDHLAEVKSAQASVSSAKQSLLEEQARSEQAETDWKRLGNGQAPGSLVLREPQLQAAQAELLSAQALLDKAKLDLERTSIVAPYAGRILSKSVDLGQVVSTNTELAVIYAVDYVEVRLPIKNKDLGLMDLPEQYRDSEHDTTGDRVVFRSDLVGQQRWQGHLVRTEGAIDTGAQQLYVVAQINDPYEAKNDNTYPIKIGQYVKASITGRELQNAMVIPNSAIYQGSYVYIAQNGVLKRQEITLGWQNSHQSVVKSGLEFGQQLVLTPLGQVSSGTAVSIKGESAPERDKKRPPNRKLNAQPGSEAKS